MISALFLSLAMAADPAPARQEWKLDGVAREALVVEPAKTTEHPPLVFVFHGHGGTAKHAAEKYAYHKQWAEAVVVYPQGLNTPGKLTDPDGKKTGWQSGPGDQKDRDLKFVDAMLKSLLADRAIDPKRVYASGHSNGGGFTYLLWANRASSFAAFAPSAAVTREKLTPMPAMHIAGENDPLVKYDWQKRMLDTVRKVNGCDADGKPAGKFCTEYASKGGTPVVAYVHPGDHTFPADAPKRIVEFFQQHAKK